MKTCGHKQRRDEKSGFCHSCYMREYRKKNPEKTKALAKRSYQHRKEADPKFKEKRTTYQLRHKYGVERYDEMCAICGSSENLCIDHCHDTGTVRGTLCKKCNSRLGFMGDTVESVTVTYKKILAYLEGVK